MNPPAATEVRGEPDTEMPHDAWTADVLLKLQRAAPLRAGDALPAHRDFSLLLLRVASLLPSPGFAGLGGAQQEVVLNAIRALKPLTDRALQTPLQCLKPQLVDLLRALARDSHERKAEFSFRGGGEPFCPARAHRFCSKETLQTKGAYESLEGAELFYNVLKQGRKMLHELEHEHFWEWLDAGLDLVTYSMNSWALATLFDGLRLRRGLEVAAPSGTLLPGRGAPFGIDTAVASVLNASESFVSRNRVGLAAQFYIASAMCATRDLDVAPSDDPRAHVHNLEHRIREQLVQCRASVEQRCPIPGKSMRIILDAFAQEAEYARVSPGARLMTQLAFAYPCLVPGSLHELAGYDGGLLSVWDACAHLLQLHSQRHGELLPTQALLCAVLGGVVGNLLSDAITGPFVVHPRCDVMEAIRALEASWPAAKKTAGAAPVQRPLLQIRVRTGRMVSATAVLCDAIERGVFKEYQPQTRVTDARSDAALTMLSVSAGLAELPGVFDSRPTDGVVSLKRLYFAAIHAEPRYQGERLIRFQDGLKAVNHFTDLHENQTCCISPASIEMAWRDVVGGALLASPALFWFSRRGFADSLRLDWKAKPQVIKALAGAHETSGGERPVAVMMPDEAMRMMAARAREHVAVVATEIDNQCLSRDGPPYVCKVMGALNAFANVVYEQADFKPLWECSIANFCSPPAFVRKRKRERVTL